ncbi:invasion associated locus B family protein [Bradyrhizobium jicamae]|uniref:Invasion associated locus B family protein n=1 Tax=Bradyrhizobium jicamae TaxID=280332 RepID=A0ABS5FDC3_9BRAD|nr:invasion associated locus B family protein [Bradyrhizobium jicamae]MBR0794788.1 invasion associated locus B family protein [Bradyrhizobium jicamae]
MIRRLLIISLSLLAADAAAVRAEDARAAQLTYDPWTKLCFPRTDGNSDCFVSAAARGACHRSGGGVSVWIRDERQLHLVTNFATRRPLDGGISVRIDQDAPIEIAHADCFGLGCRGTLPIDEAFIERLKQSRTIAIEATDTVHQKLSLSFPLAGFATAYDGPPGSPPRAREDIAGEKPAEQQAKAPECRD